MTLPAAMGYFGPEMSPPYPKPEGVPKPVPEPHLSLKKLILEVEEHSILSFLETHSSHLVQEILQYLCPMFGNLSASADSFCKKEEASAPTDLHGSDWNFTDFKLSDVSTATLVTVFCAELVLSVLGNSLVLLVFACSRQMRSITSFFIISLAVSDLMMSVITIPLNIAQMVTGFWQFGSVVCKFLSFATRLFVTASTLTLCCIAFDRYLAVVHPLQLSTLHSPQRAVVLLVSVWAVAAALSAPFGYYSRLYTICHIGRISPSAPPTTPVPENLIGVLGNFLPSPPSDGDEHRPDPRGDSHVAFDPPYIPLHADPTLYGLRPGLADAAAAEKKCCYFCSMPNLLWLHCLSYVVLLLLPILLMALAYTAVVVRLWLRRPVGACSVVCTQSLRVQYKRKAVKLLALVMFIFLVCWIPLMTFDLAAKLLPLKATSANTTLRFGLQALALAAACCNPLVYGIMHDKFRKQARALLARCCACCKLQGGSRVSPLEVTPAAPRAFVLQGRDAGLMSSSLVHETHMGTKTLEGQHATMDSSLENVYVYKC